MAPENPEIQVRQAIVLAKRSISKAIEVLLPVKQDDPHCHYPNVHLTLAKMYAQKERIVLAIPCLEPCLKNELLDQEGKNFCRNITLVDLTKKEAFLTQ